MKQKKKLFLMNNNLEEDLKFYCKTLDGDVFADKLYGPLTYIAKSICGKKMSKKETQDNIVDDMVSHCSVELPIYYKEDKGKAKCAAYILMAQYLLKQKKFQSQQKRDRKKTIYIEDMKSFDGILEIEIDLFEFQKTSLLEKRIIFKVIEDKLHSKIMSKVIDCIEYPNKYKSNYNSYIQDIAKKCKCKIADVYETLVIMKKLMDFYE